jgi:hypothetical protein
MARLAAASIPQVATAHTAQAARSPAGIPRVLLLPLIVHPWWGTRQRLQQRQLWQEQQGLPVVQHRHSGAGTAAGCLQQAVQGACHSSLPLQLDLSGFHKVLHGCYFCGRGSHCNGASNHMYVVSK